MAILAAALAGFAESLFFVGTAILVVCSQWLRHSRFGPLEWVRPSLARKKLPLRLRDKVATGA